MRRIGIFCWATNWLVIFTFSCAVIINADTLINHNTLSTAALLKQKTDLCKLFSTVAALPVRGAKEFVDIYLSITKQQDGFDVLEVRNALMRLLTFVREHSSQLSEVQASKINSTAQQYLLQLNTRAPRPSLDTGNTSSTGPIGDDFNQTTVSGCTLPDDVSIVHDLAVGNDVTVGGNINVTGTFNFHGDVVLEPVCPDTDIAIHFDACNGTSEIARIYTPSTVGGIVISTDGGVTENFRVQSDGNSYVTGNFTTTGNMRCKNGSELLLEKAGDATKWSGFMASPTTTMSAPWVLPPADGTSSQVLITDGSKNLGWMTVSTATNTYVRGGNSFGGASNLGLIDGYTLNIITNNQPRIVIDSSGNTTYTTTYKACAYPSVDVVVASSPLTVQFNTASINPGSNYNTGTGIYTAPVAGTYMIAAQVCVQLGNSGTKKINLYNGLSAIAGCTGKLIVPTYSYSTSDTDTYTIPLTGIVNLAAGDQIHIVYTGDALDTIIADGSQFSVHFMSTTPV